MEVTRGERRGAHASRVLVAASRLDELPHAPDPGRSSTPVEPPGLSPGAELLSPGARPTEACFGETPKPARETRALPSPLRSCLYECTVMHHRLEPKEHHFRYRIFMFALDLDELDTIPQRVRGFSRHRANLYTFRDADHCQLPDSEKQPIREKLTRWLAGQNVDLPPGSRITLLTLPRVLGYIFNPVSFYFCADAGGTPLCAVVQVGNTFREMKLYLLRAPAGENFFRLITPKHFYVSPFSDLDLAFDFKLRVPGETLEIHIDDRAGNRRLLLSALTGRRAPLTTARLAWFTLKYPLITVKVIALIHWHALLLWLKRLPFHRKAAHPDLQRDVLHPHASLQQPHATPDL